MSEREMPPGAVPLGLYDRIVFAGFEMLIGHPITGLGFVLLFVLTLAVAFWLGRTI
jgi:hypothetical protein